MKAYKIIITSAILVITASLNSFSQDASNQKKFTDARKLQQSGEHHAAFQAYMQIPGAEYVAVSLARTKPDEYLALLKEPPSGSLPALVNLVRGELLIAKGDNTQALQSFRKIAAGINSDPKQSWTNGLAPAYYYPVEPTQVLNHQLLTPFSLGPGSHRDNWLIRRFIALDAMPDADKEFKRVWNIHTRNTHPYVIKQSYNTPTNTVIHNYQLITPLGHSSYALQFAIDYAFFLKQQKKNSEALKLLAAILPTLNLDINPNLSSRQNWKNISADEAQKYPVSVSDQRHPYMFPGGYSSGISRLEFVRLTFGEYKSAGKEDDLIALLKSEMAENNNPARRLLARIRMLQGSEKEFEKLELEYIKNGGFTPYSATYRRAQLYENLNKTAEAAQEYEAFFEMPDQPTINLADPAEGASQLWQRQMNMFEQRDISKLSGTTRRISVVKTLQRLYASLGQTDNVLKYTLLELELDHKTIKNIKTLKAAKKKFHAAGKDDVFKKWMIVHLKRIDSLQTQAAILWMLGDINECLEIIGMNLAKSEPDQWDTRLWKERFKKLGKDKLIMLLKTIVKACPMDARSRMELLDAEDNFEGQEAVRPLEILLDIDAGFAFMRGKGDYNRTRFRNYFDLANRLMRMYEKSGDLKKLRTLGRRIAMEEKPFQKWHTIDLERYAYTDYNNVPQDLNACLALVVQHASSDGLKDIQSAWQSFPDFPAKRQLQRRIAGALKMQSNRAHFKWANLPSDTQLITSLNNVLCLARDDTYIYAGHPWGIAVYDFDGNGIIRIALSQSVTAIAARDGNIWAGTALGLYRIQRKNWKIEHLWLHGDIPEKDRRERISDDNQVCGLALDGDDLWIGTCRNIQRLNIPEMQLRAYSYHELKIDNRPDFNRILPQEDYVWVNGYHGLRRYDRKTDTWDKIDYGEHPVNLIDIIDNQLFVDIYINQKLRHRPAIVDIRSLEITPLLMDVSVQESNRMLNKIVSCYGTYKGELVFGAGRPAYVLNEVTKKLSFIKMPWDRRDDKTPIISVIPRGLLSGTLWRSYEGMVICHNDITHRHKLFGKLFQTSGWTLLTLPDGKLVLGARHSRSSLGNHTHQRSTDSGGLMLLNKKGLIRKISDQPYTDVISGEAVFSTTPDLNNRGMWLCTDTGIAFVGDNNLVKLNLSIKDGLLSNRITSGTSLNGKLYFSSAWGDSGGGIMVYDPKSCVFTSFGQSDGLATDKVLRVEPSGSNLKVTYDIEYGRGGNFRYRLFPSDIFNPTKPTYPSDRNPETFDDSGKDVRVKSLYSWPSGSIPVLGGRILSETLVKDKKYMTGAYGVLIYDIDATPSLEIAELKVDISTDKRFALIAAAEKKRFTLDSIAALKSYMQDDNPYFRAKVLSKMMGSKIIEQEETIALLAEQLDDPELRVKATALFVIVHARRSSEIIPFLKKLTKDKHAYIRALATIELCKCGVLAEMSNIREIVQRRSWGNFPFGANSSVGVTVNIEALYAAIAPLAKEEHLELMLQHPISTDDYEPRNQVFEALGKAVVVHPELASPLLLAYTEDRDPGPNSNYGAARFAQRAFEYAGKPILPVLHEALKSKNRIIRSNAARGCGAIKDSSSIIPLINALKLESGLSRASIVWALGELKAEQALPELAKLYIDARNDSKLRAGSGFRGAQCQAQNQSHYTSLRSIDSLSGEWNELKDLDKPKPIDPIANEWLLSTEIILNAVKKIRPEASQKFYRKLAGEKDTTARQEAALCLAVISESEKNIPILRNMLADQDTAIQIRSAVSLLILGDDRGKQTIIEFLKAKKWQKEAALKQLSRVKDPTQRAFANKYIAAIANDRELQNSSDKYLISMAKKLLIKNI